MKNKIKRILGILLSLVIVLGLMPGMNLTAYAATNYTSGTVNISQLEVGDAIGTGVQSLVALDAEDGYTVTLLSNGFGYCLDEDRFELATGDGSFSSNYFSGGNFVYAGIKLVPMYKSESGSVQSDYWYVIAIDHENHTMALSGDENATIYTEEIIGTEINYDITVDTIYNDDCTTRNSGNHGVYVGDSYELNNRVIVTINGNLYVNRSLCVNNGSYIIVNGNLTFNRYSHLACYDNAKIIYTGTVTNNSDYNNLTDYIVKPNISGNVTYHAASGDDPEYFTFGTSDTKYFFNGSTFLPINSIALDKTSADLTVGENVALTATVTPSIATDKTVKWSVGGTNADAVTLYTDENCTAGNEIGADATSTLTVYAKGTAAGSATVTATSNADSTKSASCDVTVNAGNTTISVEYHLWVGGVQVTSANKDDVLGDTDEGATVVFTPAVDDNAATTDVNESSPATLTLNGADISGGNNDSEYAAIYAKGLDLTINVTENSTVTGPETNGLDDNSEGIYIDDGCLTITGSGRLTTTGGESANGYGCSYGIYVDRAVTINGPLNASGDETQDAMSCGIYAADVTVSSSGTLAASGGTGEAGSCGIWAGNVTVDGSLSAIGNSQAISGTVKNSIAGTGWTDTEGTTGKASIAVSEAGQELNSYKKVQFPAVPDPVAYIDHNATTGTAETKACTNYTAFVEGINSTLTTIPAGWYVIRSGNAVATNRLVVNGTVNLILCDGATLIARRGITVTSGNTLNIYAGSIDETILGTGKLYAGTTNGIISTCEGECAGIGGDVGAGGGKVTVHGGEVTALGNTKGAGIGGGSGGAGGTVTIYGGTVTTGGDGQGKGIGAGHNGTGNGTLTLGTGMYLYGGTSANPENDPSNHVAKVENEYARSQYMTVNNSSPHSHDFTFTENGAVITATCANSDQEHIGDTTSTLTIVKPALTTYGGTGSETATLSGLTAFNSATGLSVDAADIKYVGRDGTSYNESATAPTNAGKYTAKITITGVKTSEGDDKSVTACVDYEIARIAPVADDFTFTAPSDLNYDGTAKSATVTAAEDIAGMGAVTVKYYSNAACSIEAEPVNVGTYYVGIIVTEGDNYNATTAVLHGEDWKFTIGKINPAASDFIYAAPADLDYDGTAKSATVTAAEGIAGMGAVTVKYYSDAACSTEAEPVNVGTYYVGITVTEGDNYNATAAVLHGEDWVFKINRANATSSTITVNNRTYDGTEKPLVTEDKSTLVGGEMWYALGENATTVPADNIYTTTIPTATDAGTYYVWYKVVGDENHKDVAAKSLVVNIDEIHSGGTISTSGIYCMSNYPSIKAGMVIQKSNEEDTVEYRWVACDSSKPGEWFEVSPWTKNNNWLDWTPEKSGAYVLVCYARVVGNEEASTIEYAFGTEYHKGIKGICQMPYAGEGGGYLIGIESFDNPNNSYQYEMLILDCSLLAQGKDAWIYSTGKCGTQGNSLWTTWQPQYGYYWTLFRLYDSNGNLIDETCYGFANVY